MLIFSEEATVFLRAETQKWTKRMRIPEHRSPANGPSDTV
jgi:hypothetical protein